MMGVREVGSWVTVRTEDIPKSVVKRYGIQAHVCGAYKIIRASKAQYGAMRYRLRDSCGVEFSLTE